MVRTSLIFVLAVAFFIDTYFNFHFSFSKHRNKDLISLFSFWISVFASHVLVVLFKLSILILVTVNNLAVHGVWGRRCSKTIWVDLCHKSLHCLSFQSSDFKFDCIFCNTQSCWRTRCTELTAVLLNFCQRLTTVTIKNVCLIYTLNLPGFRFQSLFFVMSFSNLLKIQVIFLLVGACTY